MRIEMVLIGFVGGPTTNQYVVSDFLPRQQTGLQKYQPDHQDFNPLYCAILGRQ